MKHLIQNIVEPRRLLLRWQPEFEKASANRTHWIVAELKTRTSHAENGYEFSYLEKTTDFAEAVQRGFPGHAAFPILDKHYSRALLDVFMKRLPPRSRGDFGEYLAFHCLPSDAVISDFALLGYTGAKLPSDGFSFIHPFDDTDGPCEFRMDVAGWRLHREALAPLKVDMPASFAPEPSDTDDPQAVQISSEGRLVGYVPRGLTESFHSWFEKSDVSAVIHSVPLPEERPELALFVTVRPSKP